MSVRTHPAMSAVGPRRKVIETQTHGQDVRVAIDGFVDAFDDIRVSSRSVGAKDFDVYESCPGRNARKLWVLGRDYPRTMSTMASWNIRTLTARAHRIMNVKMWMLGIYS